MKHAEVREFDDHATRYLAGEDVIAVERDGSVVGYYIPVVPRRDSASRREAMARLQAAVARVLEESGLTEEELSQMFDLNQPVL